MFLIVVTRRGLSNKLRFGYEWCMFFSAFEGWDARLPFLTKMVPWAISQRLRLRFFLSLASNVSWNRVTHVLSKVWSSVTSPINGDVIVCRRYVPFVPDRIIQVSLLLTRQNPRLERFIERGQCPGQRVAINTELLILSNTILDELFCSQMHGYT